LDRLSAGIEPVVEKVVAQVLARIGNDTNERQINLNHSDRFRMHEIESVEGRSFLMKTTVEFKNEKHLQVEEIKPKTNDFVESNIDPYLEFM